MTPVRNKTGKWEVIDYDLLDKPVKIFFRRPYKFPVLFRTGAPRVPLDRLYIPDLRIV